MCTERLKLEDVIALGGEKEDFELVKNAESNGYLSNKSNDEEFNDTEFKKLITQLGFNTNSKTCLRKTKEKGRKKNIKSMQESIVSSTTATTTDTQLDQRRVKNHSDDFQFEKLPLRPLLKPLTAWYDVFAHEPDGQVIASESYVSNLHVQAVKLLDNEIKLYKEKHQNSSNYTAKDGNEEWMKTVATAGTLSDRVAALSLMVQEAPLHKLHCLELLLAMAKKKGRREAITGIEAIKSLLLGDLLPDNRRLRHFHQHPLDLLLLSLKVNDGSGEWSHESSQRRLILWAFEHRLKELIASFVDHLKCYAHDALEISKTKAMSVALELLTTKPEQEKALLALLVNKLGDPKYKIASKALHMLTCVLARHPLMQGIIVQEVRDLLLRPNLAARAQYYCVCFLSSQILSHDRKEVAQKLVQIYMRFFKACVEKKTNADNKMLSALLTGVNRAFPFANVADEEIVSELDILFRTVHVSNLNTAVQSLVLLFQVFDSRNEVSDRFYNALYAGLFHTELPICTGRHPMLLNVLYRALKADPCEPRVEAFVKRLLQITTLQLPPFSAAVLTLVSELINTRPSLAYRCLGAIKKNTDVADTDKAERNDLDWLKNEDEEERFIDVKDDTDEDEIEVQPQGTLLSSWTHKHRESMRHGTPSYDPLHRNPQYAGAENSSIWELHSLVRHFHPTVALFAKDLITQESTTELRSGDPLSDYTLMKFLDRFVYRNPKVKEQYQKKSNIPIQFMSIHRRKRHASFNNATPVNSIEFLQKQKLSPEEVFFHRYFTRQAENRPRKIDQGGDDDGDKSDLESLSDDEFDRFMNSNEGQKQIDHQINFSDHVYKNRCISQGKAEDSDDGDDDDDYDSFNDDQEEMNVDGGYGFEMEDGEEDILGDGGVFITEKGSSKKCGNANNKKKASKQNRKELDDFSMMLEENITDKFDSITSSAISNKDRASVKHLKWEKKKDLQELIAKKRTWKQKDKGSNARKGQKRFYSNKSNKDTKMFKKMKKHL